MNQTRKQIGEQIVSVDLKSNNFARFELLTERPDFLQHKEDDVDHDGGVDRDAAASGHPCQLIQFIWHMWRSAGQLQPTHAAGHTSPNTNNATSLKSASSLDPFLSKNTELIPKAVSSAMYTVKPRMMRKTMVSGTIEEGVPSLGLECQRVGMTIFGWKRTTHSTI